MGSVQRAVGAEPTPRERPCFVDASEHIHSLHEPVQAEISNDDVSISNAIEPLPIGV